MVCRLRMLRCVHRVDGRCRAAFIGSDSARLAVPRAAPTYLISKTFSRLLVWLRAMQPVRECQRPRSRPQCRNTGKCICSQSTTPIGCVEHVKRMM
jgi:hypothetical protein